jgi:hypothetical protein
MRIFWHASALALLSLGAAGAAWAEPGEPLADRIRTANVRLEDATTALMEGYTAVPCASGFDGAVAVRYVNPQYLQDDVPDVARPQGLIYEPGTDGRLQLMAVEYVTVAGPLSLGGQPFKFVRKPDRYRLIVWAWTDNPAGLFADANPEEFCE